MSNDRFEITFSEDPATAWPGHAPIEPGGVELAIAMIRELEDSDLGQDGINENDRSCLENWPREGKPFRNIVLEYLQLARELKVEAGFCAVLSDYLALGSQGMSSSADRYGDMFKL
jgi:hypothetical protein